MGMCVNEPRDKHCMGKIEEFAFKRARRPLDRHPLAECGDPSLANEQRTAFDIPEIFERYPLLG